MLGKEPSCEAESRAKRTWPAVGAGHLSRPFPSVCKLQSSVQIGGLDTICHAFQQVQARWEVWSIQMLRHDGKRPRGAASPFNSTMHFKRWSSSRRSSRWDRLHLGLMVLSRAARSTIRVLQSRNYFSWLVAFPNLVLVKVSNRLVFFQFLLSIPISFQFLFRFLLRTCRVFLGFMLHTRVFPKGAPIC